MWAICEPNLHSAVRNWPRIDKGSSATHRAHIGAGPHRNNNTADHRSRYLTTLTRGIAMKKLFSITAAAALMMYGGAAIAAELPTYEVMGFPITRHQVAVLGGSGVQQRAPTPALMFGGMPASPSQVIVLTPRPKVAEGAAPAMVTTVGFSEK